MNNPTRLPRLSLALLATVGLLLAGCQTSPPTQEQQDKAAQKVSSPEIKRLLRKNDCFKCHTIDDPKDGPSWESVAEKYRGTPDAEERLFKHLTTAPIIELKGEPEEHKKMDSMKVEEVRKIARWIVTL